MFTVKQKPVHFLVVAKVNNFLTPPNSLPVTGNKNTLFVYNFAFYFFFSMSCQLYAQRITKISHLQMGDKAEIFVDRKIPISMRVSRYFQKLASSKECFRPLSY